MGSDAMQTLLNALSPTFHNPKTPIIILALPMSTAEDLIRNFSKSPN